MANNANGPKMKTIVTGGAGFIGSAMIWKLNGMGVGDIIAVDHLADSEKWKNLRNINFLDYIEKDKFIEMIECGKFNNSKIDSIIHFGACSSTTQNDSTYLISNNYEYTKTLAHYSLKKKIRFIYASSAATYGNGEKGFDDDPDIIETLKPLNMYGYSKHLFDLYALKNNLLSSIAGLKFFNVFGPNEYHKGEMCSVIYKSYSQIKETGKIDLFSSYLPQYSDGEQKRDFLYIKEAVDKAACFIENHSINGIFNIGSGKARTWNDLAYSIFKALNKTPKINYINMPESIKDKYQYFTEAKMKKFEEKFAHKNIKLYSLEEGVFDYVSNYLEKNFYL